MAVAHSRYDASNDMGALVFWHSLGCFEPVAHRAALYSVHDQVHVAAVLRLIDLLQPARAMNGELSEECLPHARHLMQSVPDNIRMLQLLHAAYLHVRRKT
jgi:hypothetical protein